MPVATRETPVRELSRAEGRELLDRLARELLGMSGDDFVRAWDSGEFAETDNPRVIRVSMLLPFVR